MIDPKNTVILTAGVVSDPEVVADGKIAKLRVGVDYAGSEKGAGSSSGYFDVVYYLKDGSDYASKNAAFIAKQLSEAKLKKGSQIQISGRLVHERWQQDNQNRSKVVIVAEAVTYVGSASSSKSDSSDKAPKQATSANSVPDEF